MAKNKTTETLASVEAFLDTLKDNIKRTESYEFISLFQQQTGYKPRIWGSNIIGFGSYHYVYASGHEGDAPLAGFSPRKHEFSLYLGSGFPDREQLLQKLGKHKTGKACIYVKKLADIDQNILGEMIRASIQWLRATYPEQQQ